MMTVYNGNVTTDANGFARVSLPSYFGALNTELKYQLTCIGTFAQAIIAEEVRDNQFVIQTDKPNVKVSWQVTGVRNDPAARAPHRTRTGKTRTRSRQVHLSGSLRQRPRPACPPSRCPTPKPKAPPPFPRKHPPQTSQPPAVAQQINPSATKRKSRRFRRDFFRTRTRTRTRDEGRGTREARLPKL